MKGKVVLMEFKLLDAPAVTRPLAPVNSRVWSYYNDAIVQLVVIGYVDDVYRDKRQVLSCRRILTDTDPPHASKETIPGIHLADNEWLGGRYLCPSHLQYDSAASAMAAAMHARFEVAQDEMFRQMMVLLDDLADSFTAYCQQVPDLPSTVALNTIENVRNDQVLGDAVRVATEPARRFLGDTLNQLVSKLGASDPRKERRRP